MFMHKWPVVVNINCAARLALGVWYRVAFSITHTQKHIKVSVATTGGVYNSQCVLGTRLCVGKKMTSFVYVCKFPATQTYNVFLFNLKVYA